jgi:hypothetical protein
MAKVDLESLSIEELATLRDAVAAKLLEKVTARQVELEAEMERLAQFSGGKATKKAAAAAAAAAAEAAVGAPAAAFAAPAAAVAAPAAKPKKSQDKLDKKTDAVAEDGDRPDSEAA